jgi:hypothetical protein
METSFPLLYAKYDQPHYLGPIRKVKLVPAKTLIRFSDLKIKKEIRINQYLTLYTSLFAAVGILAAVCLLLLQVN